MIERDGMVLRTVLCKKPLEYAEALLVIQSIDNKHDSVVTIEPQDAEWLRNELDKFLAVSKPKENKDAADEQENEEGTRRSHNDGGPVE